MNTESKTLAVSNRVKVDGDPVHSPEAQVDQKGMIVAILCHIPKLVFADHNKFGRDILREPRNPVLETRACEVEVLFRNNEWHQVWKGSAVREFCGTEGTVGKVTRASVLLKDLSPAVSYEALTNPEFTRR